MNRVAIVAMGASHVQYTDIALSRLNPFDEVWAINHMGYVIRCDRCFIMDDFRSLREAPNRPDLIDLTHWALTQSEIQIYTSVVASVLNASKWVTEFPLQDVVNHLGHCRLSSTVDYAIAYAMWRGVLELGLYGLNFETDDYKGTQIEYGSCKGLIEQARERGMEVFGSSPVIGDTHPHGMKTLYGYREQVELT